MTILAGRNVATGDRVWDDNPSAQVAFWEDIHTSSPWIRFITEFGATPSNNAKALEILDQLHGNEDDCTTGMFIDSLKVGMDAGEFTRKPVDEVPVVEQTPPPVDRNGRPLSAAQIAWGEMERWSDAASMQQVRERKRTDPAYANFVRTNFEREMDQEISGDVRPYNEGNVLLVGRAPASKPPLLIKD